MLKFTQILPKNNVSNMSRANQLTITTYQRLSDKSFEAIAWYNNPSKFDDYAVSMLVETESKYKKVAIRKIYNHCKKLPKNDTYC